MRRIADAPRSWRREVSTIIEKMQVLLSGADGQRITVQCPDGFTLSAVFPEAEKHEEVDRAVSVSVPKEAHEELKERWKARTLGRGLFRDVQLADIVEIIWEHGCVNLSASRALTHSKEVAAL